MDSDKDYDVFKAYAGSPKKKENRSQPSLDEKKEASETQEVLGMIKKMKKMHQELELKLDDSYAKLGLNSKNVKEYLENSSNFNSEEWEKIQTERMLALKKLEKQFGVKIDSEGGTSPKIASGQTLNAPITNAADGGSEKERKSKMRGARRNWIPMR